MTFLCTSVSKSTEEDWLKLRRLLAYAKSTIEIPRIFGATWVDASYATHNDMKGHTGGAMSMEHGLIHHVSSKQKLNTKNSVATLDEMVLEGARL